MAKYEYKLVETERSSGRGRNAKDLAVILNSEGADGWRLVSFVRIPPFFSGEPGEFAVLERAH